MATPLSCGRSKYVSRREEEGDSENSDDLGDSISDEERDIREVEEIFNEYKNFTRRVIAGQASRQGEWPWIVHLRNFMHGLRAGVYSQVHLTFISLILP